MAEIDVVDGVEVAGDHGEDEVIDGGPVWVLGNSGGHLAVVLLHENFQCCCCIKSCMHECL